MSEQQGEQLDAEVAPQGNDLFASVMAAVAPDVDGEASSPPAEKVGEETPAPGPADGGGDAAAGTAPAGDGGAAGTAPPAGEPAKPEPGAGGDAPSGGDGDAGGAAAESAPKPGRADLPADWTASASEEIAKLGQLSTTIEESTQQAYRAEALTEIREEHGKYFEALEKHPRLLVGTQVPSLTGEGNETLQTTQDAKDWQDAVKQILAEEVQGRASVKFDENRDFINTIHASVDLFKNNPDLIPRTKEFDKELADKFAAFAKPYELRVEGKLQGYSVPVQPIIDHLRAELEQSRAASAQTSAGAAAQEPQSPAAPADPPQAGVQSKAGSGGEPGEDFSTLFGTIGLPNLRI